MNPMGVNGEWLCEATGSECDWCAEAGWAIRVVDGVAYTMRGNFYFPTTCPVSFDHADLCRRVVDYVRRALR